MGGAEDALTIYTRSGFSVCIYAPLPLAIVLPASVSSGLCLVCITILSMHDVRSSLRVEIRVQSDLALYNTLGWLCSSTPTLLPPLHEPRSTFHHPNKPSSDLQCPVRRGLSYIHRFDAGRFRRLSGVATHPTAQERHVCLSISPPSLIIDILHRVHWWHVSYRRSLSQVVAALPPRGWSQPTLST